MNKLLVFFQKNFVLFLFLLVLISWGQMLWMRPWQEDNVIFFKIAHIEEAAGFMGKGILGQGPYRHTAVPYYFLYRLFGYNIPVYYGLMLLSYFFATVCIYFLVRAVLGKKEAMIASFLFGTGYVASEGFFRVYTSTNISSGLGFVALTLLSYWKYYKSKKLKWFFLTILMYWATVQISYVRVHYLIIPLLLFDFLFLGWPDFKKIKGFLLRSVPLLLIFYQYYIVQGDSRREGVFQVAKALLSGKFEYANSFLGSIGNLVVPDFVQKSPVIIGAFVLIAGFFLAKKLSGEKRKIFLLFASIVLANIAAYAIYTPLTIYATNYRYLAHSFLALSVILSIFTTSKKKIIAYLIVGLGIIFLFMNVKIQKEILKTRSTEIEKFYQSLKEKLPTIPKDAILYFDIQDSFEAKNAYTVSFSVAEMPETTAIAWRWGIDRYDFQMVTTFPELMELVKENKIPTEKIFSFWLSSDGLSETSQETREFFSEEGKTSSLCSGEPTFGMKEVVVSCTSPISTYTPLELEVKVKAEPSLENYIKVDTSNPIYKNEGLRELAISYNENKKVLIQNSNYRVSSEWKDRVLSNISDDNPDTFWQSDRIAWGKEETFVTINLPNKLTIGGLAFRTGHKNNVPSLYKIETSMDGANWLLVSNFNSLAFEERGLALAEFDPVGGLFVRMTISETSGGDSPQIAEMWVIPQEFSSLDLSQTEEFLTKPFDYIESQSTFLGLINRLGAVGNVRISWLGDKSKKWLSEYLSTQNILYDGSTRLYRLALPQGGTKIEKIKFSEMTLPGVFTVYEVRLRPIGPKEL